MVTPRRTLVLLGRKLAGLWWILMLIFVVSLCVNTFLLGRRVSTHSKDTHLLRDILKKSVHLPSDMGMEEMDDIYSQRRKIMIEACTGKEDQYVGNNSANTVGDHIVVDRKHKIIYCGIEKVGSTFWRRIFQIFVGASQVDSPFDILAREALGGNVETFSKIGFDEAHYLLDSSRKFLFVRNPYSRLYSGYIDKLFSPNPFYWTAIGTYVAKVIRKNASNISLQCGHDITFSEFIKYFIQSQLNNNHRDGHFIPMFDHCRPCRIHYDYIGKMETFKKDSLHILEKFGFQDLKKSLSRFDNQTLQDTINDQVDNLFNYAFRYKNCITFHDAFRRLWLKFQIRGILSPNMKFSFTELQTKSLTSEKLKSILTEIIFRQNDKQTLRDTKEKAMLDAYNSVDYADLQLLSIILKPDCEIFGYDCKPAKLFDRKENNFKIS